MRELVGERWRIVASETMVSELWAHWIAPVIAHGAINAVNREECQRIGTNKAAHSFEIVLGGQQVFALRGVDAVIIGMGDRRRGDAKMDLACARIPHHLHDLYRCGAAHD